MLILLAAAILPARKRAGVRGGPPHPELDTGTNRPPHGFMKLTTLFLMVLLLSAESKLTTEEKLSLARSEAAAAKAQATLTNFVSQAQRAVQEMEAKAKEAASAHEKLVGELKKKHALDASCTFDEAQEVKCPAKEAKK